MDEPLAPIASPAPTTEERLTAILDEAVRMLDDAAGQAANRAFNLGCFSGLLPGVLLLIFMLAFTGLNVIGGCIALTLTLLAMVAFANLAASVSRANTAKRVYAQSIAPYIHQSLAEASLSETDFYALADKTLAQSSLLRSFLPLEKTIA